jgi:hypothetical protein
MSDKRAVHTDALETLGKKIDKSAARDAIHLAVEPVTAGEELSPGQSACIRGGKAYSSGSKLLGIIDPFLDTPVKEGEMCWLIVYPRTITSLRHVWEHPDFKNQEQIGHEESVKKSERWLQHFCDTQDCPPYQDVLRAALRDPDSEYLHFSGQDASGSIPDEFWDHVENITGVVFTHRPQYFSCSC